jgi:hypothetical protein
MALLVSGLLLGLGTRWGLVRYWWVLVKLVANVVLCALIILVLRPGMPDVASYGRQVAGGGPPAADVSLLAFPPAVSLTVLVAATVVAVAKPWGRTPWSRPIRGAPRPGATMGP